MRVAGAHMNLPEVVKSGWWPPAPLGELASAALGGLLREWLAEPPPAERPAERLIRRTKATLVTPRPMP